MKPRYAPALLPSRPFRIVIEGFELFRGFGVELGTAIVILLFAFYTGYHLTEDYYEKERREETEWY